MISKDYFDLEITPDEYLKASCIHMENGEYTFLDDENSNYVKCSICGCRIKKERYKTIQERRDKDLDTIVQKLKMYDYSKISKDDLRNLIDKEVF